MTAITPSITANEVIAGVTRLAQQIESHLQGSARDEVLAQLRREAETKGSFANLAMLTLLDDCLRVVHLAAGADGVVEEAELARARPIIEVAAPRYCNLLPRYEDFHDTDADRVDLDAFVRFHRTDPHPFGHGAAGRWRGIALCQRAATAGQRPALLADHERMLVRIMEVVFDERNSPAEEAARRKLLGFFEPRLDEHGGGVDLRIEAFCRSDAPEVFSVVAHGAQLFVRDPFDVETIHAEAREVFHVQLEHAITPIRHAGGHGRMMLVLGASGSGKTHLLRALRTRVHGERLGYVGYLQMRAEAGDYARYVLANLIDSLEHPYDAPNLTESALLYLSDGLADLLDGDQRDARARLRDDELTPAALARFVGALVDHVMRHERMTGVDSDLVHAFLMLQRRDPAVHKRVVKFLRCEALTVHEQELLGGLAPRLQPEHPAATIEQLGRLIFALQQAALVILVDQVEDALPDAEAADAHKQLQRAIDVLRKIADAVPSAVVVIACLDDVFDGIGPRLTRATRDRLERDPAPVHLASERRRDEIRAMAITRLMYLYDAIGAVWRDDDPLFPFREADIDRRANQRARDSLTWMHNFQQACARAGRLIDRDDPPPPPPPPPPPLSLSFAVLDRALDLALLQPMASSDDAEAMVALLRRAIDASCVELELAATTAIETKRDVARLALTLPGHPTRRIVEVCNLTTRGGHLGRQIEALRKAAGKHDTPVAVREGDFSFNPETAISKQVGKFIAGGGVTVTLAGADLHAIAAALQVLDEHAGSPVLVAWQRERRPIARLTPVRMLLALDAVAATTPAPMAEDAPPAPAPSPTPTPTSSPSSAPVNIPGWDDAPTRPLTPPRGVRATTVPPAIPIPPPPRPAPLPPPASEIRLGVTASLRADPVTADLESWTKHAAFLGMTGSGKTTLALNVLEQLLERGVSVLLVDRKGDLARYADPAWWDSADGDAATVARRRALRERLDIALYTPGNADGRPLRLPVIPAGMRELSAQEREQVAKIAADGLGAMMQYGRSETHRVRTAILKKAIELHGDRDATSLDELRESIGGQDPDLVAAVGSLSAHFGKLAENLHTLAIERGSLLTGTGDVLAVDTMFVAAPGRVKLTILNLSGLGDVPAIQFWVSRLLIELGRLVVRDPRKTLWGVAMFDEADAYVPATSSPPTKEPMSNLLRRARSGGLGIFLASQNPGDFDYRVRDNINTWFLGRMAQDRTIEKMSNLLGAYPNVGPRLAAQPRGSFFALGLQSLPREFHATRSMMETDQLGEQAILQLARATI